MTLDEFIEKAKLFECKIGWLETGSANNIIQVINENEPIKYVAQFTHSAGGGLIVLTDKNLHGSVLK